MKIKARMEGLAYGGEFVGPVLEPEPLKGKKAFARFVCPGETIEAEIEKDLKSLIRTKNFKILQASPERQSAPCCLFQNCGGCDLQHLQIKAQRRYKLEMVRSMLARQAGLKPEKEPCLIGAELPYFYYRRRVNLHLDREGKLGFYKLSSNEVVPLRECLIATKAINTAIQENLLPFCREISDLVGAIIIEEHKQEVFIELRIRADLKKLERLITLKRLEKVIRHTSNLKVGLRGQYIFESQKSGSVPIGHFSQINEAANDTLIECVTQLVSGNQVDDLYAGSGNLAIPLAEAGKETRAIEVEPALSAHGKQISTHLRQKLQYFTMSCEKFVRSFELRPSVVLDPPRSGAKSILYRFDPKKIHEIIYVSCNLPSLSRDLCLLVEKGFVYKKTFVLDMFPQTHHVETISYLYSPARC
jgi:23S rRNA (uracil1939-C5)-methyltransferase